MWVVTPEGRSEVRLIAQRLPEDKAEEARRRARRASRKKGHTPSKETLFAAGYVLLVTNLPAVAWPIEQVLLLYRLRWQVELLFKRLKSILNLDRLRAKDPVLAQVYLLGKLVGALLLEDWTADLMADSDVACWFEDTVRPVSPWRWTSLWADLLLHAIRGAVTLTRLLAVLPRLARYLCDAPRKRRQQAACARRWLNALALPADALRVNRHELAFAQVRAYARKGCPYDFSRYALGETPVSRRKAWVKWLLLEKPTSRAISVIDRSSFSSSPRARFTR